VYHFSTSLVKMLARIKRAIGQVEGMRVDALAGASG
jgi:hypothetical protein